jgi:hypothetical protein
VISRREYYGTFKDWAIWGPLIFVPPILMLFGLNRYQLVDGNDPALLRSAALGYAVFWLSLAVRRRKAISWATGAIAWIAISIISVVGAFLGLCAFLFGNALLDRGPSMETARVIAEPVDRTEYRLMSERRVITGETLHVGRGAPHLPAGARVILTIRPGFFRSPWIAGWQAAGELVSWRGWPGCLPRRCSGLAPALRSGASR